MTEGDPACSDVLAVQRPREYSLLLRDFSFSQDEPRHSVTPGGELHIEGQDPLPVPLKVEASDGIRRPLGIDLIRSGSLLQHFDGEAPFHTT